FEMLLQLPDALDLLTISVEAGLGFDAALAKVVEKMEGPLVDEFRQALAEIRMGRSRRDALRDVAKRADSQPINNFIGAIVQAEQLGVPIAKVLQIQSNQLRIERRQRAEEAAAKAPVKMLFPMVGCISPTTSTAVLGPATRPVVEGRAAKGIALEEYAEDEIVKPVNPEELEARVQRILRRASTGCGEINLDGGELEIDLVHRRVTNRSGSQPLTPTEVRVLQVMIGSLDRTVPTETLLERVWSEADGADPSYVWVSMRRLRRKMEIDPDNPRYLLTERGIGYRLISSTMVRSDLEAGSA